MKNEKQLRHSFPVEESNRVLEFRNIEDKVIWDRFLTGEGDAFNYIYKNYFPVLFNYGHHFTKDRELVKDTVQELFIYLKTKRNKLGKTNNIKFYLYKSLRRRILRVISKKSVIQYVDNLPTNADFEISISHESHLIHNQEQILLKQKLEVALEKLTKKQKEVIIYYFYEGFNYEQIAEIMSFSKVEYARKLVYRSLATLKEHLPESLMILLFSMPILE